MKKKAMLKLFLSHILLLVAVAGRQLFAVGASPENIPSPLRMELIQRHSRVPTTAGQYPFEHIGELMHSDILRREMINRRRGRRGTRRKVKEMHGSSSKSMEMPIFAGRDYGAGQYFVEVRVGTPAQKVRLIADTGSELTWMRCGRRPGKKKRVFQPVRSSTYRAIACSSRMCKEDLADLFSLTRCPTPWSPCYYDYRYSDGSAAVGTFARETVWATESTANWGGQQTKLEDVLVGCSLSLTGQGFVGADGVLALAYSNYSFATKAADKFGGRFSYCLVDHLSHHNVSSYLTFGGIPRTSDVPLLAHMRYTELDLSSLRPFYAVKIAGISIDGVLLRIPLRVWNAHQGGGTIIDSGTSLTFLTVPAYTPVVVALEEALSRRFRRSKADVPFNYCFNSEGFDERQAPRLAFHFTNGARYDPPVKSYIIDVSRGVKCIGIVSAAWPGVSVIGNIMQQNHQWEFNLVQMSLGFGPSTCVPS